MMRVLPEEGQEIQVREKEAVQAAAATGKDGWRQEKAEAIPPIAATALIVQGEPATIVEERKRWILPRF